MVCLSGPLAFKKIAFGGPRKDQIELFFDVISLILGLSPEAQGLLLKCLFLLVLGALLVIVFYPTGVDRGFRFAYRLRRFLSGRHQRSSHPSRRHQSLGVSANQHREEKDE